ncbi:MAG: DUF92 domain-containing protein [Acidobacteria bacterium]|nr:DUF92 domain-containing protein [Acidobacteriota bacterium]
MGLFALALPFLTWQQAALCAIAAFLFNWLVLPRLLGHRLISARPGVSDRGVLLYPLVVLALIVLYRPHLGLAAFGWGVLAFGDAAAGVVGQKWGRHPLPWNSSKTCEGLIAFALSAGLSGAALCSWQMAMQVPHYTGMGISTPFPDFLRFPLLLLAPIVLATILESLPHGLDDNILPAIAGTFPLVLLLEFGAELFGAPLPGWGLCLGVNTGCALIALTTRALQPGGVAVAWALGIGTWMAFGRPAFTLLLAFLLAGLLVTFLGYGRKHQAGVAEARGGRRGAAEVFGKGGALLLLSLSAIAVRSVDNHHQAQFPQWGWVVVAILAAATADTWATELGGLWGKRAYTLWPVREAPPGTSGAVSLAGLLAALAGAALISGLGLWLGLLAQRPRTFAVLCTLAAFVATVVESLLPRLGPASHVGKNLVVTLLAPILVYAVLGVLR